MARQNNYPIFENNSTVITAEFLNGLVNNVKTLNQEDGVFDISIANAVSGVPTTYNSLELALSGTSIPVDVRKGGMAVKFINSGTGKYEQWNLKASSWSTNTSDWALDIDGSVTDGKLKLPFELKRPNAGTPVTNATEIDYADTPLECGLIYDISVAHAVSNVPAQYESLSAALGTNGANIPQDVRRGGMSIKFIQSSDNKYVQWRYMGTSIANADFVNVENWQGIDVELVINEKRNLVEGNGVSKVINSIYKSGITWDNGHYYKSDRTKGANDTFQCVSIDLTYIDSVILKNVYNNGDVAYCFLIYNNGTIKQQWNNQIIDSVTLDTSDCNLLLISNRNTNNDWEIGFEYADVRELLDISKNEAKDEIDVFDRSLSVPLFEKIDIGINVTSGTALNYKCDINIKQGTRVKLTLESTALIDSNGISIVLGYTDGTESTGVVMNPSYTTTLIKDVNYLRFVRTSSGVIGTGTIHVSLSDLDSYDVKVKQLNSDIQKAEQNIDAIRNSTEVLPVVLPQVDIKVPLIESKNCDYKYCAIIDEGTTISVHLLQTDLLATGGFNLFLGYTDGTESNAIPLGIDSTYTTILIKDVNYLRFTRMPSGVMGTGLAIVSLTNNNSLNDQVEQIDERVKDVESILVYSTNIEVPVVTNTQCNYTYTTSIDSGNSISVHLLDTNLLATGGFNLFLGYTDGTESNAIPLGIDSTYTIILTKKLKHVRFLRSAQGVIGTGNVSINLKNNSSITNLIPELPLYVSTANGNDNNDGKTLSTAKKTINAAIGSGSRIFVEGGVYKETVDLRKSVSKDISITGIEGENPVIIMPSNSVIYDSGDEETVSGYENVCEISINVNLSDADARLFFDGMNDVTTAITSQEVHPCQRGKTYRCDSTMLIPTTATTKSDALTEINTSDTYKFYYDSSEQKLYFKKPVSPTNVYPLVFPRHYATHFTYISYDYSLKLTNLEFKYAKVNVDRLENVCISDCSSKYVYGNGCFSYDNSMNVEFLRCEAARAYNGQYGDGFNSSTIHTQTSRGCSARMENCWSHDNNDDGYSDHDGQNTIINGGLFEYNGKGGVTPARGSSCMCYNVLSRNNQNGFYYILGATVANEGSMMLYNCISENNAVTGFRVENSQCAVLYNCIAINEVIGFKCQSGSIMRLMNCRHSGCTTVKDGSVNVVNGNLVE